MLLNGKFKIGGWGAELNREIVSCRACVRCVCLVSSGQKSMVGHFPFSLFAAGGFPFSLERKKERARERERERERKRERERERQSEREREWEKEGRPLGAECRSDTPPHKHREKRKM